VNVSNHPSARLVPGTVVYRLDDRLFFANAQYFRERVRSAIAAAPYDVERFVFDAEGVTHIDGAGADAIQTLVSDLSDGGVDFVVARLKDQTRDKFDQFGLVDLIGPDNSSRRYGPPRSARATHPRLSRPGPRRRVLRSGHRTQTHHRGDPWPRVTPRRRTEQPHAGRGHGRPAEPELGLSQVLLGMVTGGIFLLIFAKIIPELASYETSGPS